jgi:hypothetical protein
MVSWNIFIKRQEQSNEMTHCKNKTILGPCKQCRKYYYLKDNRAPSQYCSKECYGIAKRLADNIRSKLRYQRQKAKLMCGLM